MTPKQRLQITMVFTPGKMPVNQPAKSKCEDRMTIMKHSHERTLSECMNKKSPVKYCGLLQTNLFGNRAMPLPVERVLR